MKPFNELTTVEIQALSKEEFDAVSPFDKHSCYDCASLKGYVTIWCTNMEACNYRRTAIPGIIKCPWWTPEWKFIEDKYKTPENGYVAPVKKVKNLLSRIFSCQKK